MDEKLPEGSTIAAELKIDVNALDVITAVLCAADVPAKKELAAVIQTVAGPTTTKGRRQQ